MNIRNPEFFNNSFWDWSFLNGCFGNSGIRVSDVDGIAERNGWFLLIETKLPGVEVPNGQRRMYPHLGKAGFTVLVLWGFPTDPVEWQIWFPGKLLPTQKQNCSAVEVQSFVSRWFAWANSHVHITQLVPPDKREPLVWRRIEAVYKQLELFEVMKS